jgi:DNA polymerase-1
VQPEIIKYCEYPHELEDIKKTLLSIFNKPTLTCDIETTSLDIARAKITTIAFAWSEHEGVAFCVSRDQDLFDVQAIKHLLKEFFTAYTGALIYHNASYDICILIRELFTDQLEGVQVMTRSIHDTKLIAYLATNNTSINNLGLKELAKEFTGNYAVDFKDPAGIETSDLLEYNLIDTLATYWVFNKYYPKLEIDNQLQIYKELFLPSLKNIIHMQLNGLPMDMNQIQKTKQELEQIRNHYLNILSNSQIIKDYEWQLCREACIEKNKKLKQKVVSISDFNNKFNPNSGKQIAGLLYGKLKLPILNKTDKGNPSTDKETLESLLIQLKEI